MKKKYRSAEEKKLEQELKASWQQLEKKWLSMSSQPSVKRKIKPIEVQQPYRRHTDKVPSHGMTGSATKPIQGKVYTGTAIIGIGTMHKSNAVPIFNDSEAKDISSMRRN